jgi:hypothetical protein
VTWEDEPGYDGYTVVQSASADPPDVHDGKATVSVTYDVLGWVRPAASGEAFTKHIAREEERFELVRAPGGWRVAAPQLEPHVAARTVLADAAISAATRQAVREALTEASGGSR